MGAAFIVYNLAGMLGSSDVSFENIAKSIGMFVEDSNSINSKTLEIEKEKAKNTMDLFLNSNWGE